MEICWVCDGRGWVVICMDDICRARKECMHGDGEDICDNCQGEGAYLDYDEWVELPEKEE